MEQMKEQLSMEFELYAGSGSGDYLVLYDRNTKKFHSFIRILNRTLLWDIYCSNVTILCYEDGTCSVSYKNELINGIKYFFDDGENDMLDQLQWLQYNDSFMKFKKYESIENHYRQKVVNYILEGGYNDCDWVKLLKIHGANYSFSFNGDEFKKGKRTSFLEEGFYGDHHFDHDDAVTDIYHELKTLYSFNNMTIYGEIYGGVYNHPEVPKVAGFTKVQQQIHYCQENRFAAYDIELDGVPMGWDDVKFLCQEFGLPIVPELDRGMFEDLIQSSTVFPDPLHLEFGLPSIEGNDAEGWIIKPIKEARFHNGSRVILKGKNPKFSEQNKVVKKPSVVLLSDEGTELMNTLTSYITENRLRNVLSHGDKVDQKGFGKLLGLFSQDAFKDFMKDFDEEFCFLELDEQKKIKKLLTKEAGNIIRPNFTNIIDGEF